MWMVEKQVDGFWTVEKRNIPYQRGEAFLVPSFLP